MRAKRNRTGEVGRRGPLLLDLAILAALAGTVALVFGRTIGYGWSNWDDTTFVLRNPLLQSPGVGSFFRLLGPGVVRDELLYIPTTYASWLIEIGIAGMKPAVFHGTNVALHLLNTLLVYALLRKLVGRALLSFLGALVFAVHPIQAETVAWIMGRKDLLSAFFGLLAILAWLRFRETERTRWHVLAIVAFALGVFAKPGLVVLPAVFVLLDLHLGRGWIGGRWTARVPMLAVAAVAAALAVAVPGPPEPEVHPSFGMRLVAVPWLAWHWAKHLLLISRPVPLYVRPGPEGATLALVAGLLAVAVLAGLFLLAWKSRRRRVWGGLLATVILLLPSVSVVFGHREFVTADRYGYLPLAAFVFTLVAVVAGLSALRARIATGGLAAGAAACLVLVVLALPVWDGPLAVFARNLEAHPGHPTSLYNHATSLAELGRFREAQAEYHELIDRFPDDYMALFYLGRTHLDTHEPGKAVAPLDRAAALAPDIPGVLSDLGEALERTGRKEAAARAYAEALRRFPNDDQARDGLARIRMGPELARLRRNPADPDALLRVTRFYLGLGDADGALHILARAANSHPDNEAELRCRMARIMIRQGRRNAAREQVMRALSVSPNNEPAQRLRDELR